MTPSTPLPEQGSFNERLENTLDEFGLENWSNKDEFKAAIRTLVLEEIVGEDMTMDSAIKTHSDVGAGYTIGYNSLKAEQRKKLGVQR